MTPDGYNPGAAEDPGPPTEETVAVPEPEVPVDDGYNPGAAEAPEAPPDPTVEPVQ